MKTAALGLVAAQAWIASAAIDGTLINRTTGRPLPQVEVRLMRMTAAGSDEVEVVKTDSQGRFVFQKTPEAVHYLVEARHQGVTYSRMLAPGSAHRDVELAVYDVTRRREVAQLTQRIVFLEPAPQQLRVTETWLFRNDGRLTWYDPTRGAFQFFVPQAADVQVSVTVTAPGGMPVPRPVRKTNRPGWFQTDFPIKPGETRFDVSYTLPGAEAFSSRMEYPEVPTRLVVPRGVTLKGEGLESLGQDPSLRAGIFEVKGRREFAAEITGTGALAEAGEEDLGPGLDPILPRIYDSLPWVLGPALAALALGFLSLYRRSPAARTAGGRGR